MTNRTAFSARGVRPMSEGRLKEYFRWDAGTSPSRSVNCICKGTLIHFESQVFCGHGAIEDQGTSI